MRTNYVLIDFENVQPESLVGLQQDHFKVLVFVGANQTKVPFEVAQAMQAMGGKAEYIKIAGNGSNALDFHIAFYIGQLAAADPAAFFHIISKDTGYDPLIAHLKAKKIHAARETSVADIPVLKAPVGAVAPAGTLTTSRIQTILDYLKKPKATRPRTLKTMTSHIKATFKKQLTDDEVAELIAAMSKDGHIAVTDTKITYNL
ncbi:MAG: hypothetical protein FJ222_07555 [Lentisphaerae bacterium]|nr:hypothetical protein [Lentisphaerota bacterium]